VYRWNGIEECANVSLELKAESQSCQGESFLIRPLHLIVEGHLSFSLVHMCNYDFAYTMVLADAIILRDCPLRQLTGVL
jgi:hypothetical protein